MLWRVQPCLQIFNNTIHYCCWIHTHAHTRTRTHTYIRVEIGSDQSVYPGQVGYVFGGSCGSPGEAQKS